MHGYVRLSASSRQNEKRGARAKWHDVGRTRTRRVIEEEAGNTSGRKDRLRGQIGVRTRALSDG